MKARRRLLPLLALLALILAACGDPSTDSSENGGGEVAGGAAGDIELEASNFAFQPTELSVEPGASTTLGFTNGDDVEHSFTSDDLGLDEAVEGGASATITIDAPDKDGTHEFHCKFHPQMKGKIVVGSGGAGGGGTETTTDDGGGGGYDY
ncbi:MAG: cupredoxin domain-containing protein [Actinomycetota bacterium]